MAFTPCTTAGLTTNIATDCDEPRIKGYEQIGLIILKSDIDLTAKPYQEATDGLLTILP